MAQTQIIRRCVTMDRGVITSKAVIDALSQMNGEVSTRALADALKVEEYKVRAAVSWLCKKGNVTIGKAKEKRLTSKTGRPYFARTYVLVTPGEPADFAALMRAFCYG